MSPGWETEATRVSPTRSPPGSDHRRWRSAAASENRKPKAGLDRQPFSSLCKATMKLPIAEQADDAVFRALADASRRRLLDRLHRRNGQTLVELCEGLDMTRQAVAKHLA